ncbi:carbonic anhydrase 5A, mitochondrial isoform X1, partial [Tachysurus ichikawai]
MVLTLLARHLHTHLVRQVQQVRLKVPVRSCNLSACSIRFVLSQ